LAVSKQEAQKFEVEGLNLSKLNELKIRKEYQIKIPNWFAALGNLSDSEDINMAWENIKENISISTNDSLYRLRQHKPWFDDKCLCFLDQSKQAKMQLLQDANQAKAM
jgi:hypothetical protein